VEEEVRENTAYLYGYPLWGVQEIQMKINASNMPVGKVFSLWCSKVLCKFWHFYSHSAEIARYSNRIFL